jgi:hypothetical protein
MLTLLRKEPPYATLRLTHAFFEQPWENRHNAVDIEPLIEAIASHEGIHALCFPHSPHCAGARGDSGRCNPPAAV